MLAAAIAAYALASLDPAKPAAAETAKVQAADAKKVICWTEEPVGSHIPHHYCAPVAYWELRQRMDREWLHPFGIGGGNKSGRSGAGASSSGN